MKTTNTTTMALEMAELINDNRYIASAQLSADDMGMTAWKQYRQLCDILAVQSWNSICKTVKDGEENYLAIALNGLFSFFGCDAKAIDSVQKRFILACVTMKKEKSVAMKKAEKALREAKSALEDLEATDKPDEAKLTELKDAVDTAQEEVDRLKSEPMNIWYNKEPMLDKATRKHATPKCRKFIEDTIADLMHERSLMTAEELQKEAQKLADERKGRELRKKKEAKSDK